jgi:hypothetical protein
MQIYNGQISPQKEKLKMSWMSCIGKRKFSMYPLYNLLLKLVIVLYVVTATTEMCFSPTKLVKPFLCNVLNDDSLSGDVICYVQKEEMKKVNNNQVVIYFLA